MPSALSHRLRPSELVAYWAKASGGNIAIADADLPITYAELNDRIEQLASQLCNIGVAPGVQVALLLPNSTEFIVWFFAVIKVGALVATLDPNLKDAEITTMLDGGEIDLLVTHASMRSYDLPGWLPAAFSAPAQATKLLRRTAALAITVKHDGHYSLHRFSSGSTGQPKHVLFTADNIADDYLHLGETVSFSATDVFLGVTPFFHSFGGLGLLSAMAAGASIIPVSRFIPADILNILAKHNPTIFFATPPMLELLGKCHLDPSKASAIQSLTTCICATGRLSQVAHDQFQQRFQTTKIFVLYGSSETASCTLFTDEEFVEGCVGNPMPGVAIKIFDDASHAQEPGTTGRVGIKSPSCVDRYHYSDAQLRLMDGFILPGDKGYIDSQGRLHITGRDDVINIGGYKVDRFEVEACIRSLFDTRFIYVCEYTRAGQPAIRAIIESDDRNLTAALVIAACKQKLTSYKVPSRVDIVHDLPRDSNGKVKASALQGLESN